MGPIKNTNNRGLCKKDTESEDETEKLEWSEHEIVRPWEVL